MDEWMNEWMVLSEENDCERGTRKFGGQKSDCKYEKKIDNACGRVHFYESFYTR